MRSSPSSSAPAVPLLSPALPPAPQDPALPGPLQQVEAAVKRTVAVSNHKRERAINFHSIADLISPSEDKENQNARPYNPPPCQSLKVPSPGLLSPVRAVTPQQGGVPLTTSSLANPLTSTPDPNSHRVLGDGVCSSRRLSTAASPSSPGEAFPLLSPVARLPSPGVVRGGSEVGVGGRKGRTIYRSQQVSRLEQVFTACQYPESEVIENLAAELGISEAKVKVWFQNKRARLRRRLAQGRAPSTTVPQDQASVSPPALLPPPAATLPLPQAAWQGPTPALGAADPRALLLAGMVPGFHPSVSQPGFHPSLSQGGAVMQAPMPLPGTVLPPQPVLAPTTCAYPCPILPRPHLPHTASGATTMHPSPLATLNNLPHPGLGLA